MIWGGLGHSQLDIDVGQQKWRLSTSSSWVSVRNFVNLWTSNVEAHKTGLVSRVQVWYGGEHTPVSGVFAGFRARGGPHQHSLPYSIHVHLPTNLLY